MYRVPRCLIRAPSMAGIIARRFCSAVRELLACLARSTRSSGVSFAMSTAFICLPRALFCSGVRLAFATVTPFVPFALNCSRVCRPRPFSKLAFRSSGVRMRAAATKMAVCRRISSSDFAAWEARPAIEATSLLFSGVCLARASDSLADNTSRRGCPGLDTTCGRSRSK